MRDEAEVIAARLAAHPDYRVLRRLQPDFAGGPALVGGILAGPVEGVEWDFGRTLVLDGGFLVPITPPVNRAPPADAGSDDAKPPSGAPGSGRTGRSGK